MGAEVIMISALIKMNIQGIALSAMPFYFTKKFRSVIIIESEVMQNGRILLNIQEVCDYLGIGKTKARELLRGYNGFGVQIGNRWYANKKKLDEWIDNETM